MKKAIVLMSILVLMIPIFSQIRSAYAVSSGFERYQDDRCDIYLEYFPVVPFDPSHPTASEEFAFTFQVTMYDKWDFVIHTIPDLMHVIVCFQDVTCGDNDYPKMKTWFPIALWQEGYTISYSVSGSFGMAGIGATIKTEDASYRCNFTEFPMESEDRGTFTHLSHLSIDFNQHYWWGSTHISGAASVGIPNDLAQPHEGHHVLFAIAFELVWIKTTPDYPTWIYKFLPIFIGDDDPADSDCWLEIVEGQSESELTNPTPRGGCPTLFAWDGKDYAEEGILNIHAEPDITVQHEIQNSLVLKNGIYNLQLRELDEFTSHIDQVKLYAVDYQGEWNLCPLTYAYHNELGRVTWKLLFDDEKRVDLIPTQIIDLKFLPSIPYRETAYFIFEINGYNVKVP